MENQKSKSVKSLSGKRGISFAVLIVIGLIQAVLTVLFALAVKNLINAAEYSKGSSAVINSAIYLAVCVSLIFVFSVIYRILHAKCQTEVETNIKKTVIKKFISGDFGSITKIHSGDLLSRLNTDVTTVANVYVGLIPSLVSTVAQLVAILVALYLLQPLFTLLIVGAGVVVFLITYFIRKITAKLHRKVRDKDGEVNSVLSETSQNAIVIKSFNAEESIAKNINAQLDGLKKFKLNQRYFTASVSSLTGLLFTAFYAVTVIYGGIAIINGSQGMDFGVIVAMLQLILQIRSPLGSISSYVTAYAEMNVSLDRLYEIISQDTTTCKTAIQKENFKQLEFNDVSFGYDNDLIIKNSSFTIVKGDKVLIKGPSGVGKSTLVKLLLGLYLPNSGNVTVTADSEISTYNAKGVFSFVPQGNTLFSGTIKQNLTINGDKVSLEDINSALEIACANDFIKELPLGLDTVIGERGLNLSEGQAQRISIARSILQKAPVIVLDEFTSALDSKTESQVINNLSALDDVTLIVISHKTEANKICNKVIEITDGIANIK